MDNLATRKVPAVAHAVRATSSAVLYLPPDSADFIRIEQVLSKIKNGLRRREHRTITELEYAFGESLDTIHGIRQRHRKRLHRLLRRRETQPLRHAVHHPARPPTTITARTAWNATADSAISLRTIAGVWHRRTPNFQVILERPNMHPHLPATAVPIGDGGLGIARRMGQRRDPMQRGGAGGNATDAPSWTRSISNAKSYPDNSAVACRANKP